METNRFDQRRIDIVEYCVPKPRTASEIKKEFGLPDSSVHNDIDKLRDSGLIEKTLYNDKPAYKAVPTNEKVQEKGPVGRGKIWRKLETSGYADKSGKFKIPLDKLKEILSNKSDNPYVDEDWINLLDINKMTPRDYRKLAELLEDLLDHKDENQVEVEIEDNSISGKVEDGLYNISCMTSAEEFVGEFKKRENFDMEDEHGRRKGVMDEKMTCDETGKEIQAGEVAFLEVNGPESKILRGEDIEKIELVRSL